MTSRTSFRRISQLFTRCVRFLVLLMAGLAGVAIFTMMAITAFDVVSRACFARSVTGAYDLVKVCGGLAIVCSLPYTTAVKGHVAVEFFFHKLRWRNRVVVDSIHRVLSIALFGVLCWQSLKYAASLRRSGEVMLTLQFPVYPLVYVLAVSCAVVILVILHNLLHPGKEMIRP